MTAPVKVHRVTREKSMNENEIKANLFSSLESTVNKYRTKKNESQKAQCIVELQSTLVAYGHNIPEKNLSPTFDELVKIYSKLASAKTRARNGTSKKAIPLHEFSARVQNLLFGAKYSWNN